MDWSPSLGLLVISSLSSLLSGGDREHSCRQEVIEKWCICFVSRTPSIHTGPSSHSTHSITLYYQLLSINTIIVSLCALPRIFACPPCRTLETGINLFVCNMSLSDMIMCLTAAPLTPITSFTGQWFLGELPCKILPACQVDIHHFCELPNTVLVLLLIQNFVFAFRETFYVTMFSLLRGL